MKKEIIKKVNATMVEQLVNFQNYKISALAEIIKFVNNSSIPNKEEVIEEYKQMVENQEEEESIVLGGNLTNIFLNYDDSTRNLYITNEVTNEVGVGVVIKGELDYFDYLDIADVLNDEIEKYFDGQLEDCGEYWEIKE